MILLKSLNVDLSKGADSLDIGTQGRWISESELFSCYGFVFLVSS